MSHVAKWLDKPYYSLNAYFKHVYGEKCYKIALDGGFSCPNRDGTIDFRGCNFCSSAGSGDFSVTLSDEASIDSQLAGAFADLAIKRSASKYVAYFQAYTNTHGPIDKLRTLFTKALSHPLIIGISIATRPDCMGTKVLDLLKELKEAYPDKFIWVELGLQSIHKKTAEYIRRGYPLEVFEQCVKHLHSLEIPVIVHIILGLPNETLEMILDTVHYVNHCHPFGIKYQLLHVLKETDLAIDYKNGLFKTYTQEEYISLLSTCIAHTAPDIVLHRVTGDGPKDLLISPTWSSKKLCVLNDLHHYLKQEKIYQGRDYYGSRSIDSL